MQKGYYYYFGSAQKNLLKRIERHKRKDKIIHWHIDKITTNKECNILKDILFEGLTKEYECILRGEVKSKYNLMHPIKNFGNSDCDKCYSHLLFSTKRLNISEEIKI